MNAKELLDEIFRTKLVHDAAGNEYQLGSNVDVEEGAFLTKLIQEYKPKKTIEIGCAYGISSLFICDALEKIGGGVNIL